MWPDCAPCRYGCALGGAKADTGSTCAIQRNTAYASCLHLVEKEALHKEASHDVQQSRPPAEAGTCTTHGMHGRVDSRMGGLQEGS